MSTKHTQGPWHVSSRNPLAVIESGPRGNQIAKMGTSLGVCSQEEAEANARLIAAAPELLAALELCEGNISSLLASTHPKVYGEWLAVVSAAIAKATGGVEAARAGDV